MTKYLVVLQFVNPNYKPKYRLFSTKEKAAFFCKTLPPTTSYEIVMVSEDME